MKNFSFLLTFTLIVGLSLHIFAQEMIDVPLAPEKWEVKSESGKFEEYLGEQTIYLPDGFAHLKGVEFHNGIIEFDIAFPVGRGFPGVYFRIQNDQNAEDFYVRPHQSNNPDANQYTPVFNGLAGWQLYHGEGFGAPVQYKYDAWNHIKLVIRGTVGEVFINDMNKPLYQIFELKHGDIKGSLALKGSAKAHFANFKYSLSESPELMLSVKAKPIPEERVVKKFNVSNSVKDADIIAKTELPRELIEILHWTAISSDNTGTLNIARVAKPSQGSSTVLVKFTVNSDNDQVKRLEFGYSDIAQIFVNAKAVYLGNNTYRSRDYRYLGTIGYFDSIFVNLKEGENEIVFSVTEAFGGWGMKAQFDDLNGISLK